MISDFDFYWERCIRQLGAAAQDPKAVAKWCFDYPAYVRCEECRGSGYLPHTIAIKTDDSECHKCGGSGVVAK